MDENERATLKRLLTDRRMQRVWAELTKHKRNRSYETTDEPFHQPADLTTSVYVDGASGRMWMEKLDLDGALVTFLFMAYHLAVHPEPSMTHDEAEKLWERLSDMSRCLAKDAGLLRKLFDDSKLSGIFNLWRRSRLNLKHFRLKPGKPNNLGSFVEAMEELSRFFRDVPTISERVGPFPPARFKPEGEHPLVIRRTTREGTRVYILELANTCKTLFNSSLYSTVVTAASVALREEITTARVMRTVQRAK